MDKREDINDVVEEENTVVDEAELEDIEENIDAKVKKLRDKLKACESEKMAHMEEMQRTKADFLNSKRRLEEQLSRDRDRISASFVASLLPLADSFDMAMSDPSWESCDEKWKKGIEAIKGQLDSTLRSHNVTAIEATDVPFDPNQHEAVAHDGDGETVTKIMQKGYKMGEEVIRPARVTVGVSNN